MIRAFRNLLFLVLGVCLGGAFTWAHAETIAATATAPTIVSGYSVEQVSGAFLTPEQACSAAFALYGGSTMNGSPAQSCTTQSNGTLYISYPVQMCSDGSQLSGGSCATVYSCPAGQNWTLSGQQCTRPDCVAPQVRLGDGTCGANCVAGQSVGSLSFTGSGGSACMVGGCANLNGCEVGNCSGGSAFGTGATARNVFNGCTMTGAQGVQSAPVASSVPPTPPPAPTADSCLAAGMGYYTTSTGAVVCMANSPGLTTTTKADDSATTSSTDPNAPQQTTTKQTTTTSTCDQDGTCTVTKSTSTTTTPQGGTPTTTTTQATQSQGSFCEENPNSTICKGAKDSCVEHPERAACAELGTPVDPGNLQTSSYGPSSIVAVSVPGNNSCPADIAGPRGVVFSYAPICDGLGMFRYIVLAVAWLSAGLIVIGAAKNG